MTASRIQILLVGALLTLATAASAYEVKKDSEGDVVRWKRNIQLVIDEASLKELREPKALGAIEAAIRAMDEGAPGLEISIGRGESKGGGYRVGAVDNSNDVLASNDWDYGDKVLAVTLLTLNVKTNEILDADIIMNSEQRTFRVLDPSALQRSSKAIDDIQNTMTHEVGHVLGLLHAERDSGAVMYPSAAPYETSKRVLANDDRGGLMSLYSEAFFAEDSGATSGTSAGCSAAGTGPLLTGLLGLCGLLRRRRGAMVALALAAGAALADEPAPVEPTLQTAFLARVTRIEAMRDTANAGLIVSEVQLTLDACLSGDCQSESSVRIPGGRIGDIEQVVLHYPVPKSGELLAVAKVGKKHRIFRLSDDQDRSRFGEFLVRHGLGHLQSKLPQARSAPQPGVEQAHGLIHQ
jgi:hypothetical protein